MANPVAAVLTKDIRVTALDKIVSSNVPFWVDSEVTAISGTGVTQMISVRKGQKVLDVELWLTIGLNAGTCTVGDGGSAARYIQTGDDTYTAAGVTRINAGVADVPFEYLADDTIDVTVATGVTGSFFVRAKIVNTPNVDDFHSMI